MKTQHTKGEWKVNKTSSHFEVYCITKDGTYFSSKLNLVKMIDGQPREINGDGEQEANAKLIAAAPELLEAVEYLSKEWGNFLNKTNIPKSFYSNREIKFINEAGIKMTRAIKKAKGEI